MLTNPYLHTIGFNTANLTHDDVLQSFDVTALQWLCHKVGHHVLCGAPLNDHILYVDPIHNEEVQD